MKDLILTMLNELRPEFDFDNSNDFVSEGLLDSFDIISLVSMLEEKYSIKIEGIEIIPENFASVETIEALVKKYRGEG